MRKLQNFPNFLEEGLTLTRGSWMAVGTETFAIIPKKTIKLYNSVGEQTVEGMEGYQTRNYMDVSKNSGTTKSSILIGFSIINHPFWGTPIFGNTHIYSIFLDV